MKYRHFQTENSEVNLSASPMLAVGRGRLPRMRSSMRKEVRMRRQCRSACCLPAEFFLKQASPTFRSGRPLGGRSEEHTSELQSLMRISYDVFCLKKQTISNKVSTIKTDRTTV